MRTLILLVGLISATLAVGQDFDYSVGMCDALSDPQQYSDGGTQRRLKRVYQTPTHYLFSDYEMFPPLQIKEEGMHGLVAFRDALRARGTELLVMPVATRALAIPTYIPNEAAYDFRQEQLNYQRYVRSIRRLGVNVVDFSLMVGSGDPTLFYKRDYHWSAFGAKIAAGIVAEQVKALSLYEGLERAIFKTEYAGVEPFSGAMAEVFEDICGQRFPAEFRRVYRTNKLADVTEESLFGNVKREVTLVGTSLSALQTMNFPGYLSEALSVEVHDYSLPDGDVYGALYQFLNSEEFQAAPPKLLIWEFPLYRAKQFNDGDIYGLLNPSLNAQTCDPESALVQTTRRLGTAGGRVFVNAGDDYRHLKQKDLLFDIQIDDPKVVSFDLDMRFVERRKQRVRVRKNLGLHNNGRFVVDPGYDKELNDFHLMTLDVKPKFSQIDNETKKHATVTTTICKK